MGHVLQYSKLSMSQHLWFVRVFISLLARYRKQFWCEDQVLTIFSANVDDPTHNGTKKGISINRNKKANCDAIIYFGVVYFFRRLRGSYVIFTKP